MARGKQTCQNTGVHQMSEFRIIRKKKKKNQIVTTVVTGIRCKWCKKPEGRFNKEISYSS